MGYFLLPLIAPYEQAKDRICRLIQSGIESGARAVLDGRDIVVSLVSDVHIISLKLFLNQSFEFILLLLVSCLTGILSHI